MFSFNFPKNSFASKIALLFFIFLFLILYYRFSIIAMAPINIETDNVTETYC